MSGCSSVFLLWQDMLSLKHRSGPVDPKLKIFVVNLLTLLRVAPENYVKGWGGQSSPTLKNYTFGPFFDKRAMGYENMLHY